MLKCVSVKCSRKLQLSERERLAIIDGQGKIFMYTGLFGSEKDLMDKAAKQQVAFVFVNNSFYLPESFLQSMFPERMQQLSEMRNSIDEQCECESSSLAGSHELSFG